MRRAWSSVIALAFVPVLAIDVEAQTRGARGTATSARADAPIDLTGQWVAIISEDWRWRMITPPKGDIVMRYKLADANISYNGRGFVAASNQMGWLARFFNSGWAPY